jgi:hypothetical protein
VPANTAVSSAIARVLRQQRERIALALVDSVVDWEKYCAKIAESRSEFARRETTAFVDYLTIYFSKGDPAYRNLYIRAVNLDWVSFQLREGASHPREAKFDRIGLKNHFHRRPQ